MNLLLITSQKNPTIFSSKIFLNLNFFHLLRFKIYFKFLKFIFRVSKEFSDREAERETLMNRRVTEYEKMEKQLRKALLEAKKGEARVLEQERELGRLRDELQAEKDRIRQDAKTTFEQQKRELSGMLKVKKLFIKILKNI